MEIIAEDLAVALINSKEKYPIDFDDAWKWIGYSQSQKGKTKLFNNFEEGIDYQIVSPIRVKSPSGGRPSEHIVLTIDCFKSLAMMAGTDQGKKVRRYFLDCENKLKTLLESQTKPQRQQHLWWDRIALFQKHTEIPRGYWTVFMELAYMWMKIEGTGYVFPEKACLDISVGICWNKYLRSQNICTDNFPTYPHHYPDHRETQDAKIYPDELLPMFRNWVKVDGGYYPSHLLFRTERATFAALGS